MKKLDTVFFIDADCVGEFGGMSEIKDLNISILLDFYEQLMTKKQAEILRRYFDNDHSLAEIAQQQGISRQAAQDTIRRGTEKLRWYESALGLQRRYEATQKLLADTDNRQAADELKKAWED